MGGDDDVVEVGFGEQGGEERVWVRQPIGCNYGGVRHKTIAPAHGIWQLATTLDEEKGRRGNLHNSSPSQVIRACQIIISTSLVQHAPQTSIAGQNS